LRVDRLYSRLLIAFMNAPSAYVADQIFPALSVVEKSGLIPRWRKEEWFKNITRPRAPGTESQGSGFAPDTNLTYFCQNYATHIQLPDEIRMNQQNPFNVEQAATDLVATRLKLYKEITFATNFFAASKWATDLTPTDLWNDYANSDPIGDIETGKDAIHAVSGVEAKTFAMGRYVWTKLRHHPDFLERIKYTQKAVVTTDLIASLLELDKVLIGRALYLTSGETPPAGTPSPTLSYVFGKHALLVHTKQNPSLLEPVSGVTFHWAPFFGGNAYLRRLRFDETMSDRFEGHTFFDQKILANELGYFFESVVP
jgi:hypothetical protein